MRLAADDPAALQIIAAEPGIRFGGGRAPQAIRHQTAMGALLRSAYRAGWRSRDDAVRQKISEILKRAAQEIDALVQS